ncbi:hypothetical protein NDU88_005083 [Pleurodeles waltl]|uniref:Uncharacterized protein n=1 Tax=Pleurodeles waltl TaxID=8319 RepID=A0AAV7PHI2_PLEWA|nr:hypothetical protein NDU88_005083 [Pleurodeles waltl]
MEFHILQSELLKAAVPFISCALRTQSCQEAQEIRQARDSHPSRALICRLGLGPSLCGTGARDALRPGGSARRP